MYDGVWYCDGWDAHLKILHRVRATLFDGASPFQRLQVLDTHQFGRMLAIDGLPQAAEADEGVYARAFTWPALLARDGATRVLITGGGDGHVAREALRFPHVRRVVVCDIDPLVTRVTRELMPFMWGEAPQDPRLEVRHEDALAYLAAAPAGSFDVVISDITDPSGEGTASHHLYSDDYVARIKRVLTPGGICVAQAQELSVKDASYHGRLRALLGPAFGHMRASAVYVPSFGYPEGFLYASDDAAALTIPAASVAARLRAAGLADDPYFDAATYEAMFVLPPRLRL
ncbi:MAG: fused MFS/spermidine synthase [Candidatus Rokubacteria bacterium]|nr:fused MFS/spermidine synthase [Candidatus Rokubacteria bacterium]